MAVSAEDISILTNFSHLTGDALDNFRKTRNSSGTSGLRTDPSDHVVLEETGPEIPDFRIGTWRGSDSTE